jgi:two-component system response regulator RstA
MTLRLLLVEDDRRLAALVAEYLRTRGCEVSVVHDGLAGLSAALAQAWDCVLLDLMLPGLNGVDVCRRLRERSDVPVLMITALDSEPERVLGLEAGADGYICKPFSSPELLARVRAAARRYRGELRPGAASLTVGDLHLDLRARTVTVGGQPVALTTHEYDLLVVFAERPGVVLTRDRLLELTHADPAAAFDRSIDGHISRLRSKLGDDPRLPARLRTVRGAGYLLVPGEGR